MGDSPLNPDRQTGIQPHQAAESVMVTTNFKNRKKLAWEIEIPSKIGYCRHVVDDFVSRVEELGVNREGAFLFAMASMKLS